MPTINTLFHLKLKIDLLVAVYWTYLILRVYGVCATSKSTSVRISPI